MKAAIAKKNKTQAVNQRDCKHHWVIKPPNGAKVLGRCKLCGLQRKFPTAPERLTWAETRINQFAAPPDNS